MALESTIEKYFCKRVADYGGMALKTTVLGRRGFPDRLAVFPGGVVWFVELKRPKGGVVAAHQTGWHEDLAGVGATILVLSTKERIDEALLAAFGP